MNIKNVFKWSKLANNTLYYSPNPKGFNIYSCMLHNNKYFSKKTKSKKSKDEILIPVHEDRELEKYTKQEEKMKKEKEKEREDQVIKRDAGLQCLVLHPVLLENKGAIIESLLAEEAIGLAKSLDWQIVKGPFWKKEDDIYDPINWDYENKDPNIDKKKKSVYYRYRNKIDNKVNKEFQNGDYAYAGEKMKGVYYRGGLIGGGSDTEDEDLYDEWKNLLLRESLANSSLVKVRRTKASTFFPKGRINQLGEFLKTSTIDVIFINTTLSFVQKRNLEITFNNYINEKNDRIRAYNIKSALKTSGDATDTESNFSHVEVEPGENGRRIRILDRFNIILSIFSQRAKSMASQLQIELAYLKYIKTRLARGGHVNYGALYKDFGGDFLNSYNDAEFEVVSGKQSSGRGTIGGSGETQLEIEKRKIALRETAIKNKLEDLKNRRMVEREQRIENKSVLPTVALLGYTNAGKTALMNKFANTDLDSENKLFQTLNTTIKKITLPTKQTALLLDTVGFISDLPHELVESFKSTLEEVFYADVLLHVIDVSNPNHLHQKKTVYDVLEEIFPKNSDFKSRIVEVWNKIDLLEDINVISGYIADCEFPIVPISVKKSVNIGMLSNELTNKINSCMGKEVRQLRCKSQNYDKLYAWLKDNIGQPTEINYDEQTEEMVLVIAMDESQYQRYVENFIVMRENKRRKRTEDSDE